MFRFSIRELMLTVAVICLTVGWWSDHQRNAQAADDAKFLAEIAVNDGAPNCANVPHLVELCHKYRVKFPWIDYEKWERLSAEFQKNH